MRQLQFRLLDDGMAKIGVNIHHGQNCRRLREVKRDVKAVANVHFEIPWTSYAQIGYAWLLNGRPEETESHIREAIEASSRDTNMYIWIGFIAAAKLYSGADEDAVIWLRRTLEYNRSYGIAEALLLPSRRRPEGAASA